MALSLNRFDWNRARAFLITAQEGSLSAAARALETTQPTVGRQIAALEAELGATLFERVPRGLVLTEAGLELLDCVKGMGESANELSLRASGQSRELSGPVCISASELQACYQLPAIIELVRSQHPGIQIEIAVSNEVSDLKRREADIAIRNFRPTQPDLIVKKLGTDRVWLYGVPELNCRFSNLDFNAELADLPLIGYERSESNLSLLKQKGFQVSLDNISIYTRSYMMQMALVEQGVGLGIFSERIGDANTSIERAFEGKGALTTMPIWLVCHRELHTSLRVRKVFDALVAGFDCD